VALLIGFVALAERVGLEIILGAFLATLLVVRALPTFLYRPVIGTRGAAAAGLLQATSLPFIVTATAIGVSIDAISPVTGGPARPDIFRRRSEHFRQDSG
jgi:hypothetical protein